MTEKKLILLFALLMAILPAMANKKPAYLIFNSKGKIVSFGKMVKYLQDKDLALFGELHNNPISHWLQLELTKEMSKSRKLILGAEMFEADNQGPLSDYLKGAIDSKGLDSLARLWKNYKTDYAPLVDLAKSKNLSFIATNVPRKYANLVYDSGFEALDTLSGQIKAWMAPLPIPYDPELPGYLKMNEMLPEHESENLPKAQALKDATMAYFILKNFVEGNLFIHFNGAYHTENHEGIIWYLNKSRPDLKYVTITTVSQPDCLKLDKKNRNLADFIICVDEDMTTTY